MKLLVKTLLSIALILSSAMLRAGAAITEPAESPAISTGEIKKVDKSAGKLTIKHGPLRNLGMSAMTMVFRAKDPAMLQQVKPGDKIHFIAEEPNGQLTVTQLEKAE